MAGSTAYLYVDGLEVGKGTEFPKARVELEVQTAQGIKRQVKRLSQGMNLHDISGGIEAYKGLFIRDVDATRDIIELSNGDIIGAGEVTEDVAEDQKRRIQIREVIRAHLDKERELFAQGIKTLSLFFIDEVAKYRDYDREDTLGEYARVFVEEYVGLLADYLGQLDFDEAAERYREHVEAIPVRKTHEGYFSIDKKKIGGKTVEVFKDTSGTTVADNSTYELIMRKKEELLSFSSPLKFIFSHSALKEGWDNPNVFQICNFSARQTERWRRQTIGRGLRLCVNQEGLRVRGFDVNTLTVIALEAYEEFAEKLQREVEEDAGIAFGVVPEHLFAGIPVQQPDGSAQPLGFQASKALAEHLLAQGYIAKNGKVQDALRKTLKDGALALPPEMEPHRAAVMQLLKKVAGRLEVKNADDRKPVPVRRAVLDSPEFKDLWDRIKYKTTYRVQFDNAKLLSSCIEALKLAPPITKTRLHWRKAGLAIGKSGIDTEERDGADTVVLNESDIELPDILTELQDRTQLTRRSIGRVLIESGRLDDFKRNPQQFIEIAAKAINSCKQLAVVDGIRYQRIGDGEYYAQELFEQNELMGYMENMVRDTTKSVYEHVVYQSDTEKDFAIDLEKNSKIKVYAKLPGWFKVPTPLGSYNPDWAVVVATDEGDKLYFVVETKSSLLVDDLRLAEAAKIKCGMAHFEALRVGESPARYGKFKDVQGLLTAASGGAS